MKKLFSIFLIFFLTTSVFGQWSGVKPMLGRQVNKAHQLGDFVGAWFFLEGSGDKVFDLSGNSNDGALNWIEWTKGKFGYALDFDGDDDWVEIGTTGMRNYPGTISAWVKYDGVNTGDDYIVGTRTTAGGRLYLSYTSGTDHFFGLGDDGAIDTGKAVSTIGFHQITLAWNSGTYWWYYDGVEVITGSYSGAPDIETKIGIGCYYTDDSVAGGYFDGKIDHIMIYNRALTASDIALLYREPFCMFEEDLSMAQMYSYAAPPPPGGQVITIIMSMIPLLIIPAFIFVRRGKFAK